MAGRRVGGGTQEKKRDLTQDHPYSVLDIKEIKGPSVHFVLLWGLPLWEPGNLLLPHLQINPQCTLQPMDGWMLWLYLEPKPASSEAPSCSSHFLPLDASTTAHNVTSLKTKIWPINLVTAAGRNSINRDQGGEMEGLLLDIRSHFPWRWRLNCMSS